MAGNKMPAVHDGPPRSNCSLHFGTVQRKMTVQVALPAKSLVFVPRRYPGPGNVIEETDAWSYNCSR